MTKKIRCQVSKIENFSEGNFYIELSSEGKLPLFLPGQFLHLTLEDYAPNGGFWPESRVFSICSSPRQPTVSFVYSVKGKYTKRMEQGLQVGTNVWVKLPFGDFIVDMHQSDRVVLIAGGTGVSPFIPFLASLKGKENIVPVDLHYGVREVSQFYFKDTIVNLMRELPQLNCQYYCETAYGENVIEGRISVSNVLERKNIGSKTNYYLSGPPGMISFFSDSLEAGGISKANILIDAWE